MKYYKLSQNKWKKLTQEELLNINLSNYKMIDLFDKIDNKIIFIGKGLY